MKTVSELFYRIVYEEFADQVLNGVISPEGRFHHSGQPALYLSPSVVSAGYAVISYVSDNDPPRVSVPLQLNNARLLDVRDPETCEALQICPKAADTLWRPQRAAGDPATTWQTSDAVRNSGANGMIYSSRRQPDRWHVVLFRWNDETGTALEIYGEPKPWLPEWHGLTDWGPTRTV